MPRIHKPTKTVDQLPLDFEEVMQGAAVRSREDYEHGDVYDPVGETVTYMHRAVEFEAAWETTIQRAREELLSVNACELYFDFINALVQEVRKGGPKTTRTVELLTQVAFQGLGMGPHELHLLPPSRGGAGWRVEKFDTEAIQRHLQNHIVGPNFLNEVRSDSSLWSGRLPVIGASDVSQHVSQIPIPARFFKRTVPFVLNNAAGTIFTVKGGQPFYENLVNPRPDEQLLQWMLIDPSYRDELDDEDYRRCLGSSMDVGQYNFDLEYLLNADKRTPRIILRDGSLFPQDAKLTNFAISNKRGKFTREAIRKLLSCLTLAQMYEVVYCGIAKRVNLKIFSAPLEWFIQQRIDRNWTVGAYTLNDGEAMTVLLSSPTFTAAGLDSLVGTCLIKRSFTTRATLNVDPGLDRLEKRFDEFQRQHEDVELQPYRQLCKLGHFWMLYLGHAKSPQQQLPRYEFFDTGALAPSSAAALIVSALSVSSLAIDDEHSFMSSTPVTYLLPNVTQQAHHLSKEVGKYIDRNTGQWIMSRYRQHLRN